MLFLNPPQPYHAVGGRSAVGVRRRKSRLRCGVVHADCDLIFPCWEICWQGDEVFIHDAFANLPGECGIETVAWAAVLSGDERACRVEEGNEYNTIFGRGYPCLPIQCHAQ